MKNHVENLFYVFLFLLLLSNWLSINKMEIFKNEILNFEKDLNGN